MSVREWWVSGTALEHIRVKHSIEWDEIDEALKNAPRIRRGKRVRGVQRYVADGPTPGDASE